MSWNDHHSRSERLAQDAAAASGDGDTSRAESLYRQAAQEEAAALDDLPIEKVRTRSITAVSAVALWYKAREYSAAEVLAYRCLAIGNLASFGQIQLRNLLQMVWTASSAASAGVKFLRGDVLVAVKGGEVIYGGAPLDLILQKVEGIRAVLFRTAEMLLKLPFRKRGGPPADIQDMFRPWLFQAPAGSYQFAVRVREPKQMDLWEIPRPKIEEVTGEFFRVLRATASSPEDELPVIVPDPEYRAAFLSLSRNLAPSGKRSERIEILDTSSPADPVVTFVSESRQDLNAALRKLKPPRAAKGSEVPATLRGILRAVHLDQDWLEIVTTNTAVPERITVEEAGDALDDVVGPMVNHKVIVSTLRRGSKYVYQDMDLEE